MAVMRQCGMGEYVPMKWADYRKPHLWECIDKTEKRVKCLLRAHKAEMTNIRVRRALEKWGIV